ncbi:MAG: alpha/beta fold hydrolase [Clostridia bacterium]|nr:alpha/beta fold hydrolase [Clostridia bacterium]
MKKSILRKLIAVMLTLSLVAVPAFCLLPNAKPSRDVPEISIHGFMNNTIYMNKGTDEETTIWDWSTEEIMDLIKSALPALAKLSVTWDWDGFADEVLPLVKEFFDGTVAQPDGSPDPRTEVVFNYPPAESITSSSYLTFSYDWRADPVEIAADLNDFIDYVLEASGCDQVTITAHSLGGIITLSYISIYGNKKVRGVCFNTTAIYGETYTGELLSGQMVLNADAVQAYLEYALEANEYEKLLNGMVTMLNDVGLLDFVCQFGNLILEKLSPKVLPEIVAPLFAGMPTIWAMVPDEYMDASLDYVFNVIYKDSDVDRSGLIDRIDNYNTLVREHKTETLVELNETADVYVISRYGYSSIPITPSYLNASDSVIDTKYSSFGATVADYGTTLSDDYIAGKDAKYISPDKVVDASTCLFPDQTWFIKNLQHSKNGPLEDMMTVLLYSDGQATVDTYPVYPQYMKYDRENDVIVPYTEAEPEPALNAFEKILKMFRELFLKIKNYVRSILPF